MDRGERTPDIEPSTAGRAPFASREIALLGLMAALWGVIEITVGGMIKGWHVPFGGSLLSTFGVVVLLTARASVPRRWSSILVGVSAAGIRFVSGFGGASAAFAALGIAIEALIVELVLSLSRPGERRRYLAGALAVLWSLAHPFVVQGYLAGYGPRRVMEFTVGLVTNATNPGSPQMVLAFAFLILIHVALGVSAVMFVDRILLAPSARARRAESESRRSGGDRPRGGGGVVPILLVATTVALAVAPARAQQTDPSRIHSEGGVGTSDAYYSLPELTVYGTRLFGPYSVFQLSASDLDEVGAEDLSQALEMVPGMVVRTNSRGEAKLSTRGLADRELVVLVDGVPISDPYTGAVNPSMVLAGALGSVRVTKGPAASVYGANALGGIVEVTTVGNDRSGLGYRLAAGGDGKYSGYVSGGGRVGVVHLTGGVAANGSEGYTLPASYSAETWEDGGMRDHSGSEDLLAWGRASWKMGSRTDASLSLQVADGRRDAPASTNSSHPRFWRFPYWREVRAIGSLGFRPTDDLFVESKLYYGTNDNELAAYSDFDRTDRMWLSTVSNRAFGGYAYSEYRGIDRHRISGGLNVRGDVARLQSDVGEEWTRYEATTASVYGQDVVAVTNSDRLALAVNTDMMNGEARSLLRVNPQAAWTHSIGTGVSVRALVGMKTRFPTLKEWFSPEIGNPDLIPERSTSVELELTKRTSTGSRLSILGYRQSVQDMIVSAGKGSPAENIGAVSCWGAELGVFRNVTPALELEMSLAMTSAKDVETNEFVPLVPRTTVTALATYRRGRGTYVARVTRVGSRYDDSVGVLDPYYLFDVRSEFITAWGTVFMGVDNVFDTLYEDEDGFPQPGRSFEIGIARDLYR